MRIHTLFITLASAGLVAALSANASAQANFTCKATETQPECFARLKCKADEELEACQKRLRAAAAQQNNANHDGNHADDRRDDHDDRGNDRGDDRGNDRDDDRRDDRDDDRGNDDRDDRGDRGRGRRHWNDGGGGGHRRHRRSGGGHHSFEANKTFGAGLELGEPTGLNGKLFLSDRLALDFGLGWIYDHYYYGDGAHLYADLLFHPVSLASNPTFELPFYIGGGLRFWSFDYCYQNVCDYGGSAVGIRVPIGLAFDFNNVPLDIFVQLVPTIDFVRGDYYDRYRDRNHFGVDFSLGIRFWFK